MGFVPTVIPFRVGFPLLCLILIVIGDIDSEASDLRRRVDLLSGFENGGEDLSGG